MPDIDSMKADARAKRRKSIKENPNKERIEDKNPVDGFDDVKGTDVEVAPSTLDVAAEHVMRAKDQFILACSLIPDCRERAVAATNFDTALLWIAEAMNMTKLNQEMAEQRAAQLREKPKYL